MNTTPSAGQRPRTTKNVAIAVGLAIGAVIFITVAECDVTGAPSILTPTPSTKPTLHHTSPPPATSAAATPTTLSLQIVSGSMCLIPAGCDVPIAITNTSTTPLTTESTLYARLSDGRVFAGENDDLWYTDLNPGVSKTFIFSFTDLPMGSTITEFYLADSANGTPEASVSGRWRAVATRGLR